MAGIVTFYSYKGGVGRSMALANVGLLLARKGRRVLMIDWDLEAPGLERYFKDYEGITLNVSPRGGLLHLLLAVKSGAFSSYKDYVSVVNEKVNTKLDLLTSGREADPVFYSKELGKFGWHEFFSENQGGHHVEQLRKTWLTDYDWILIDSRTGLSDASGVCTILLPDVLVPMFTANYQSLFGIRDTLAYIKAARQTLNVDRMSLTVLPVPSRFGTRIEFKQSQEWIEQIASILKDSVSDWLPKWVNPRFIIENVKVPQVDYFSFGEKLAVVEQSTTDPESMAFVYQKIANIIDSDFADVANLVGPEFFKQMKTEYESKSVDDTQEDKMYDIFIGHTRESYPWISQLFLPALFEYLEAELGFSPKVFFDASELNITESWSEKYMAAIASSRVLLIINDLQKADPEVFKFVLDSYRKREVSMKSKLVFGALVGKNASWIDSPLANARSVYDFSDFTIEETLKSTKLRATFGAQVSTLAKEIAVSIKNVRGTAAVWPGASYSGTEVRLMELAREYDFLRLRLPSGSPRTNQMESIVRKMKTILAESKEDGLRFANQDSAGERLIAIAGLQVKPRLDQMNWLTEHVGDIEKPFIGYQAAIALYIAMRAFRGTDAVEVSKHLHRAMQNIKKYSFKDPNQIDVIESALAELKN
jgi:cellulose biosynthesis protein BcsQ